jgi:hypothetical protein
VTWFASVRRTLTSRRTAATEDAVELIDGTLRFLI